MYSLSEKKDNLKGLGRQSQDPIPIEGENNMLRNVLLSRYYAILDIICFAYLNTKPIQKLTAKGVIL
jgi:hypothetical protein